MTQPIDIEDLDISPLSLAVPSPTSTTTSSFSNLSLGSSTLIDSTTRTDGTRSDIISLSSSRSSDYFDNDSSSSFDSCTDPTCCPPPVPHKTEKPLLSIPESSFSNLVIVGAGPHALGLAARLSEPRPAALYTDLEHARLSWLQREQRSRDDDRDVNRRKTRKRPEKEKKKQTVKGFWSRRKIVPPEQVTIAERGQDVQDGSEEKTRGIVVLDGTSDEWMGRWKGFFRGLRIKTLRSPMLFHPAPADVDALVAYAKRVGGEDELEPIHGVVGKELSKHQKKKKRTTQKVNGTVPINERDRQDYYRPSTNLFNDFIAQDIIDRYSLSDLVTRTTVTSITYGPIHVQGQEPSEGFIIRSENPDGTSSIRASKAAVIAVGPSNRPNVPPVIQRALPRSQLPPRAPSSSPTSPWNESEIRGENWCHSSAFSLPGFTPLDGPLGDKIKRGEETTALVIGGGLTSVQIIDSLLDQGVTKVHLICRSHIKIKHFDFPLCWVSKYNNLEKASFWNSPNHSARFAMIQQARDGGSVNPEFYKLLNRHVKAGRIVLRTLSSITHARFEPLEGGGGGGGSWSFKGETVTSCSKRLEVGLDEPLEWELNGIDYLVSSTGSKIHLDSLPFLERIRREYPVGEVGGLPCLTGDLQWNQELPLFVMGAYSMLELGPDALNLSGCRTGAERVAHRLGQLGVFETIRRGGGDSETAEEAGDAKERRTTRMEDKQHRSGGEGNFFRGLSIGVEA